MKITNNHIRSVNPIIIIALFFMTMTLPADAQIGIDFQPVKITESSFRTDAGDLDRFRLKDNDVIHLKMEKVAGLRDKVEIVLKSSSNVTWWKGVTVFKDLKDVSNRQKTVRLNHIDTQDDDHGPESVIINVSDLGDSSYLTFEKAKALGAHTPMYRFDLKGKEKNFKYAGYRLTFTWERDG